ncbi:MAG: glycosyltransferase, partial [Halobacteriovoraceae bacterium]|nr:glycosyltransferase [Halobacteriovoraceae bacterium]
YAGRVSEQKNIHGVLQALSLLKKEGVAFNFLLYGDPDFHGHPNMGISSINYLRLLKRQIKELNLEDDIHFKGRFDFLQLEKELSSFRHIFISAGSHADENFGVSACRSLLAGNRAVLSNWGGHQQLKKLFKNQVQLVDVYQGPHIPPVSILENIKKAMNTNIEINLTEEDLFNEVLLKTNRLVEKYPFCLPHEKLHPSTLNNRLINRRRLLFKLPVSFKDYREKELRLENYRKIFSSYRDYLAKPFLSAYGAK